MVCKLPHARIIGLVLGMTVATTGIAAAQDTTQAQPSDTSEVQNPPGYRGMERDTTMVPPSATTGRDSLTRVEDRATGTHDDSTWQDTTGGQQNPAGYRGMERPTGGDTSSAADTGSTADSSAAAADTSAGDTTAVGQTTPRKSKKPEARPPTAGGDTTGQGGAADTTAD
jgi:hypothetical protein